MASRVGRGLACAAGWGLVVPLVLVGVAGPAAAGTAPPPEKGRMAAAQAARVAAQAAQAAAPDLAVTISAPDLLAYGDTAHLRFTVTNVGDAPSTAADLQVDRYPQQSGSLASGCTAPGPSETADCPVAALAPGASVTFDFFARPPESDWGGSGTVSAALTPGDANPANDSASRVVRFAGPTTFQETFDGPGPTVTAGSIVNLRVTLRNTGQNPGVAAFRLLFDETMAQLDIVGPDTVDCSVDPFEWLCSTEGLEAGSVTTVVFPFRVPETDVGRRLNVIYRSDVELRWTALVVGDEPASTTSPPASDTPKAAARPATGLAAADPTLPATGAPLARGALLGSLLLLVGLALVVAAGRIPRRE